MAEVKTMFGLLYDEFWRNKNMNNYGCSENAVLSLMVIYELRKINNNLDFLTMDKKEKYYD